jgi:hypothetical protein
VKSRDAAMSAYGTKQTSVCVVPMSALEVKRAFIGPEGYVCFWPKADVPTCLVNVRFRE